MIFLYSNLSFGQNFYLVGAASVAGWNSADPVNTYMNNNLRTVYTYLEGNQSFRFLGQQAWAPLNYSMDTAIIRADYRYFTSIPSNNVITESWDNENMKLIGNSGYYKVEVNTNGKTLTISAQPAIFNNNFQELYLTGNFQNWDPSTAIAIPADPSGVGKYKTSIGLHDGAEFKILGQKSWGSIEYGNIGLNNVGFSGFLGYYGDNSNFKINGGGYLHTIEIDLKRGTIKITNLGVLSTEVTNNVKSQLVFYPNPAKDKIIFSSEVTSVSIYDLSGKLIFTSVVNEKELNISNLRTGNYILKANTKNGNFTKKLIKK